MLNPGDEFHFEITSKGTHVIFKIDDVVVMDYEFPEEYILFSTGDEFNLAFVSQSCRYEVKNLAVYCEDAESYETSSPTPTRTPTQAPAATSTAQNDVPTSVPVTEGKSNIDPFVIAVIGATVILLAVTGIVITVRIRKNKK